MCGEISVFFGDKSVYFGFVLGFVGFKDGVFTRRIAVQEVRWEAVEVPRPGHGGQDPL